jgi:hypothetical protein
MKKLFFALRIVFVFWGIQSCVYIDSNDIPPRGIATRNFDFRNFTSLQMGSAFRVHVTAGSTYSVSATGEQNDLDDLQAFVQNGVLVVRYSNKWRASRQRMDIDISMPALDQVNFSGAVVSDVTGFQNMDRIKFELSGASGCDFEGTSKNLEFDLSGASHLEMYGESQYLNGKLSGASQINAFDLTVEASELSLSGASIAKVWVTKSLNVDASGASSVRYKGNPEIRKQLSGASTLRQE